MCGQLHCAGQCLTIFPERSASQRATPMGSLIGIQNKMSSCDCQIPAVVLWPPRLSGCLASKVAESQQQMCFLHGTGNFMGFPHDFSHFSPVFLWRVSTCLPSEVISGWSWKYVQLAPSQSFNLSIKDSEQGFLKLIRGTVLDVNQIGVQMLGCYLGCYDAVFFFLMLFNGVFMNVSKHVQHYDPVP